jgi:hypothetical protein
VQLSAPARHPQLQQQEQHHHQLPLLLQPQHMQLQHYLRSSR